MPHLSNIENVCPVTKGVKPVPETQETLPFSEAQQFTLLKIIISNYSVACYQLRMDNYNEFVEIRKKIYSWNSTTLQ